MSKPTAKDELRTGLTDKLADLLSTWVGRDMVHAAVVESTADWRATRKDFPNTKQHPLEDSSHGHQVQATLPFVPETSTERDDREARAAARSWAWRAHQFSYDPQDLGYDNGECPPPPARVGVSQLLDQGLWWRARMDIDSTETTAIRLSDMTHDHRMSLLAFLRKRAATYKLREDWAYVSMPGPSGDMASDAFETECNRQWETPAAEWLEAQPLIQALVYWTTPVAESPSTWRPIDEAARTGTIVVRWTDIPEHGTEFAYWDHSEYRWCAVADCGPFNDEPDEWRELRADELPEPAEFDPSCDHGVPDEEHCPDCLFDEGEPR